ncbi:MAG: exodeoxyribonuclease III [Sinobacteraceae bacterium]|nr:exodeoxyribonuclease III [Nevskiaceae bacterium]
MKIATWNVNSLKVRLPQVLEWLKRQPVDVLMLQETKLADEVFPFAAFAAAGYHAVHNGQKTYNGVALVARHPLREVVRDLPGFPDAQKRAIAATLDTPAGPLRLLSLYIVNGEAVGSEKFAYKLRFLDALREYLRAELARYPLLAAGGDYNIAPEDRDVHDPELWRERVLCSSEERQRFHALLALGLKDCFRQFEQPEKSYTWWDYRQAAFRRGMGLRIDHVLASIPLASRCTACTIDVEPRRADRPSDHAPLTAEFDLGV